MCECELCWPRCSRTASAGRFCERCVTGHDLGTVRPTRPDVAPRGPMGDPPRQPPDPA